MTEPEFTASVNTHVDCAQRMMLLLVNPSDRALTAGLIGGGQLVGGCTDKKASLSPQCERELVEKG